MRIQIRILILIQSNYFDFFHEKSTNLWGKNQAPDPQIFQTQDPDQDPQIFETLDPDPDPHEIDEDPKPWSLVT